MVFHQALLILKYMDNKLDFLQNTIQLDVLMVRYGRGSYGWCGNFVAPSKVKAVLCFTECFFMEGELQEKIAGIKKQRFFGKV